MKQLLVCIILFSFAANAQDHHSRKKETKQERFERIEKLRRERFEAERKLELEKEARVKSQWQSLGRHVFSATCLSVFSEIPVQNIQKVTPYGISLSYELFITKNFSLQTPVFFALNSDYKKFAIACKIYPNNGRRVKYAACPTFFMCTHKVSDYYYDEFGFAEPQVGRRYAYGFSFDNSLNIVGSKNIYICLSTGPGFTFSEQKKYKFKSLTEIYEGENALPENFITFNFSCLIGYRF